MPLIPTSMVPTFVDLALNYPNIPEDSARKMASAYDSYAKAAIALGGTPIFTGSEKSALESALMPAFKNNRSVIATYANAWYQGIVAYWTPVLWTPPPGYAIGAVTVPPAATITSLLVSTMSAPNEAPVWAQSQATALHAGVAGVMIVTFPPVPPTPAPLLAPVL